MFFVRTVPAALIAAAFFCSVITDPTNAATGPISQITTSALTAEAYASSVATTLNQTSVGQVVRIGPHVYQRLDNFGSVAVRTSNNFTVKITHDPTANHIQVTDPFGKIIANQTLPIASGSRSALPLVSRSRPCLPEGTKLVLEQLDAGRVQTDELALAGAIAALIAAGGAGLILDVSTIGAALPLSLVADAGAYLAACAAYMTLQSDQSSDSYLEGVPIC